MFRIMAVILICCVSLHAEVPGEITYQGHLKEYGQAVTGTRTMCFKIYDAVSGGNEKWSSENTSVTVKNGMFNKILTPSIDWRGRDYYIETIVSGKILSPREKITAQVYSLHSRTAEDIEKTAGAIHFSIGASTPVVIDAAGNLGIGTTNPQYKIDCTGSIHLASGGIYFPDGSYMVTAGSGSAVSISNNADAAITADADSDGSGQIKLSIAGNEKMIISSEGNVGIGTTAPNEKLDVNGSIRVYQSYSNVPPDNWTDIDVNNTSIAALYTVSIQKLSDGNNLRTYLLLFTGSYYGCGISIISSVGASDSSDITAAFTTSGSGSGPYKLQIKPLYTARVFVSKFVCFR